MTELLEKTLENIWHPVPARSHVVEEAVLTEDAGTPAGLVMLLENLHVVPGLRQVCGGRYSRKTSSYHRDFFSHRDLFRCMTNQATRLFNFFSKILNTPVSLDEDASCTRPQDKLGLEWVGWTRC